MTVVNIDLKDVGSGTNPVDKVIFYSPVYRDGATSSELVSTAEHHVYLSDGVGYVNLAPGPVRVRFAVRGIADTVAKDGVVPNDGPVSLNDVIRGSFTYTPAIVDHILASVSDRVSDEMDNRIPSDLSLRLDTTVGTRIFAGDTMIYGDTGWRDITSLATNIVTGYGSIMFRRVNYTSQLIFDIQLDPNTTDSTIIKKEAFSDWAPLPPINGAKGTVTEVNTSKTYRTLMSRLGSFTVYGAPRGTVLNGQVMWTDNRIWTTLPGTPS